MKTLNETTAEMSNNYTQSPHYLIGKLTYQTGIVAGSLSAIREDLHMGNHKEALAKVNEVIKYIDERIAPQFYNKDLLPKEEETSAQD